jgi:hypothetical protein
MATPLAMMKERLECGLDILNETIGTVERTA